MVYNEKCVYTAALRWWQAKKDGGETSLPNETPNIEMSLMASETSLNSSTEAKKISQVIKCVIKLEHNVWKTIEPVE
ncbi:hypothetical protein Bhyg_03334, partial [Pseudolycoriella hygida]